MFATHYLDEADAYADRIVLIGKAASSPTARRPRSRTWQRADRCAPRSRTPIATRWRALSGVTNVELRGDTVLVTARIPTRSRGTS